MKKIFSKHLPATLTVLAGIFLLTTGFDRYTHHPLKAVTTELLPSFSLNDSRILVVAKVMTPEESKRSFGHDLLSRGVKPLQLTVQNNTSNEYSMCPSSVDLPRIEASKIAFKVTKSAIPRSIGYKIASFFFWPFMIPSTIDGIRVMAHHQKLKKDIIAKSMKDEIVAPYSTFNRVLFVSDKQFQETFKVTLIDLDTLKPTEMLTTVVGAEKPAETEVDGAEAPVVPAPAQ
ncbi:MAG: hypothetical protein JSS60_04010 [Verrucomicrobia bacterium]|nr:hypothetical protein [Verrucomicrobiota bacterium]